MYKPTRHKKKVARLRHLIFLNKWRNNHSRELGYIDSNKWKIRGWKRRVKFLNSWGEWILTPWMISWDDGADYTYERYKISPWYRFYKHRQPPLWFFQKIVQQLVKAFDSWNKIFSDLKKPFDLFLEIYDPHYIMSEIECRKMENYGDKYSYWPVSEESKTFPYDKFGGDANKLTKFEWTLQVEVDFIFESEFEYRQTNAQTLFAKGYVMRENRHGIYFIKSIGDVWVGRKKDL